MPRLHLIEIEDQPWCPSFLRNAVTDYLAFVENLSPAPYREFVEDLAEALAATDEPRIVDLCSGGGGPLPTLSRLLAEAGQPVTVTLTDLHPNRDRFRRLVSEFDNFSSRDEPVDARQVPRDLIGLRLLCESFHHFRPQDARAILQDAIDQGQPIALFELVARTPGSILGVLLSPPFVVLGALFLRPFSWRRVLLSTLIPLIPFLILFDGIVSCLRIYSPRELDGLIAGTQGAERYRWKVQRRRFGLGHTTTLVGYPASDSADAA